MFETGLLILFAVVTLVAEVLAHRRHGLEG